MTKAVEMIDIESFVGIWQLTKRIDDRLSQGHSSFAGTAEFAPVAGGLSYHETGHLTLPDQTTLQAERRYLWRAETSGITVYFADGRFFHGIPVRGGTAHHLCGADDYVVDYDFAAWPEWRTTWTVTGPRKDYCMASHYCRP